jgi:uncharacterized membrane protein
MQLRRVPIAHGWRWIVEAFELFRQRAVSWMALNLALVLAGLGLLLVPLLGGYLLYLLSPVFLAGLMSACRAQENGQEVRLAHLFAGFRDNASALVTVGGVCLVGQVLITGGVLAVGGAELQQMLAAAAEGNPVDIDPDAANRVSLAVLVGSVLLVPLAMALWFAPALVILDGVPALRALHLSMQACLLNLLALLLYGTIMLGLLLLAAAPYLLGLVLWMPLAAISGYTCYRDVFAGDTGSARPGS